MIVNVHLQAIKPILKPFFYGVECECIGRLFPLRV
jgi:hypothetical protein